VNASTVIAACAVVIAVGSLVVSVYEARATRAHNRHSVQPLLVFRTGFPVGGTAGLILANSGLGPAKIINTTLMLDGAEFGDFSKESVDKLRGDKPDRPHATTLGGQPFLDTDYEEFLLSVRSYDRSQHSEFRDLIEHRLGIEIEYSSLYGERFMARYHMEEPRN
jgi:hypothetical protein